MLGRIVRVVAVASLVLAYVVGQVIEGESTTDRIQRHFPGVELKEVEGSGDAYRMKSPEPAQFGDFLLLKSAMGWGGPALTAVRITEQGRIVRARVLAHKETPVFFRSLQRDGFFRQFSGKRVDEPLQLGRDIDAVSGASVSSRAFADAIRISAHDFGRNHLHLEISEPPASWDVGANEIILIVLYAVVLISAWKKILKVRRFILAFSVVFIGFHLGTSISVSSFGVLLLGHLPPLKTQLFWWLLVVGSLLLVLIFRRNYYCSWMCPYGGIQEWISTIAGFRLKLDRRLTRLADFGVLFLFWFSLMIMFLTTNPTLGMYEPFATLFSFKGSAVQWYLVSVSIFASFLIPRFWCRFFCPAGVFFRQAIRVRRNLVDFAGRF